MTLVAAQLFAAGSYSPPEFRWFWPLHPPHVIILLPVQTAVCQFRAGWVTPVADHVSVEAWYLPPLLKGIPFLSPPHTIISAPVQTAVWLYRPEGASAVLAPIQVSVDGLYLPPLLVYCVAS